jgi:O-antigen/teichoic acid export membrane protein
MRSHISNAAYGVLDYAAYPIAMLIAAPTLLRHLGTAQYGVWVVCTAAVSIGGIIASGFGDANIQHVATMRGRGNTDALLRAVRSMVGINLLLGSVIALTALALAPTLSRHVASSDASLYAACLRSLRIASVLMLVRAIESVCISTQRAFERYGEAVRVSILVRVLTIAFAAAVTRFGYGVSSIMVFTFAAITIGTALQLLQLKRAIAASSLWPAFDRESFDALFGFGIFSWMQATSGVLFSQADRLILGASLGATAVTSYALCVQMAQPIYGIAASGLHFLFPYLAGRRAVAQPKHLRKAILVAFAINLLFVFCATAAVLLCGRPFLHAWIGEEIAQNSAVVLSPIVWSFALLGLNVTGYYAMLALGRVRLVAGLNFIAGAAMLLIMAWLLPRVGIRGVAIARLVYSIVMLTMYYPLFRVLLSAPRHPLTMSGVYPVWEDA